MVGAASRTVGLIAVVTAVISVALLAACTGGSKDDGPAGASSPLEICEDLTFLPCPRQTATIRLPLTGSNFSLVYASDRVPGRTAAPSLPAQDLGLAGWSLDVLHRYDTEHHVLVLGDGTRRNAEAVSLASGDIALAVGSVSGAEVYLFDDAGRHLATVDAITGSRLLTFEWAEHGLESLTEPGDRTTTVVRDDDGDMVAIVGARGYRTRFGVLDGWLAAAADATGNLTRIATNSEGLVTAITPAEGGSTEFAYDDDGLLVKVDGPGSRTQALARRDIDGGFEVSLTTGAGRTERLRVQREGDDVVRTLVNTAGLETEVVVSGNHRRVTTADGSTVEIELAADPLWGMSAPVVAQAEKTTSGGRHVVVHERRTSDASEATVEPVAVTRSVEVDGAAWTTTYDPATRQVSSRDPSGLTRTTTLDEAGRPLGVETDGAPPQTYQYSARGVIETMTVGSGPDARVWRYGYDTATGSVTITDPLGALTSVTNDANGHAQQLSAPGTGAVGLERDTLGRIVGVTSPSGATWGALYGAAGDVELTTRPAGATGAAFTTFARADDGLLNGVVHSGVDELTVERDAAGRPTQVQSGDDGWAMTYAATGAVDRIEGRSAALDLEVDGGSVVGQRWTGPYDARVDRQLDGQGRLVSFAVDEGDEVTYEYDDAGRVSRAGALDVTRDPESGRVTEEHVGALVRRWQYNGFGEVTAITVEVAGRAVHSLTIERDGRGRVVRRTEVDGDGVSRTTAYGYDNAGRLASTVVDGGPRATYTYDGNGNLTQEVKADGSVVASTYAADDTLVQRGDAFYAYDRAGRLATVTTSQGATTYRYDLLGNLLSVSGPSGEETTYVVDGAGRRIAREGSTGPARGFVYLDGTRPAAMLDEDGQVLSSFTYGSGSPTPAYVEQGGRTLLVVTDDIGTPRGLVDVEDGSTVWQLRTDEWGRVQSETDFSQFPFAFAGGLADPDTTLLRFGARDYDTDAARWTAPDPIGLGGGDSNLYRYVGGDPVNRTDPSGLTGRDTPSPGGPRDSGAGTYWGDNGIVLGGPRDSGAGTYWGDNGIVLEGAGPASGAGTYWGDNGIVLGGPRDSGAGTYWGDNGIVLGAPRDSGAGTYWGDNGIVLEGAGPASGAGTHWGDNGIVLPGSETDPGPGGSGPGNLCDGPGACEPGSSTGSAATDLTGAVSGGDPHLRTLDGVTFDFQAAGEFTALRSDSGDLVVQVRQQVQGPVRSVTWNTAVAVEVLSDRLTFAKPDDSWDVRVDGAPTAVNGTIDLPGGGRLVPDQSAYSVVWPDGTTVRILGSGSGRVDLQIVAAPSRIGTLHGLLGPFTGEAKADTIEAADGTLLDSAARGDHDRLYRVYGDSWRISQEESRFDYTDGESTATFADLTIPDTTAAVQPNQAAEAVCRAAGLTDKILAACALDVAVTGDAGYALRIRRAFAVLPVNIDGPSVATPAAGDEVVDIEVGDTIEGTLADAEDVDRYRFSGDKGDAVALVPETETQCADLRVTISSPGTGAVAGVGCDGVRLELPVTGQYQIDVRMAEGGSYGFEVRRASAPGVSGIDVGDEVSGQLREPGERHEYTFDADAGDAVFVGGEGPCDIRFQVFGPDGEQLGDGGACLGIGRVLLPKGGRHRIVVSAPVGFKGSYTLSVLQSSNDERFEISVGDEVGPGRPSGGAGQIDRPGAVDIYVFDGRAGEQIVIRGSTGPVCFGLRPWTDEGSLEGLLSTCGEWTFRVTKDGPVEVRVGGGDPPVGEYSFTLARA